MIATPVGISPAPCPRVATFQGHRGRTRATPSRPSCSPLCRQSLLDDRVMPAYCAKRSLRWTCDPSVALDAGSADAGRRRGDTVSANPKHGHERRSKRIGGRRSRSAAPRCLSKWRLWQVGPPLVVRRLLATWGTWRRSQAVVDLSWYERILACSHQARSATGVVAESLVSRSRLRPPVRTCSVDARS